jgi:hypothetical protein
MDEDMSVYEPPRATKAAASKPKHNNTGNPSSHQNKLLENNRKTRDRESGAKVLNQLINRLARSHLNDKPTKSQLKNMRRAAREAEQAQTPTSLACSKLEKKLAKQQRTEMRREARKEKQAHASTSVTPSKLEQKLAKQQRKEARREARKAKQARKLAFVTHNKPKKMSGKAQSTSRKTHSTTGMLPLGFDSSYLVEPGNVSRFLTNDQIRTWIMSVYTPHLKQWYQECLSAPANQYHLIAAQNDPHAFTKAILLEAATQHNSAKMLGPLLEEEETCPTAFHLQMKQSNNLSFVQHSAMVACIVVRDGHREGSFKAMKSALKLHRVAATLLTTVIMDLKTDMGYFLKLFLGIDQGSALSWEDSQALLALKVSKEGEQATNRKAKITKVSKTIQIPSNLFRGVGEALLDLQRTSKCKADLHEPRGPGSGCRAVLPGTAGEVSEAEQVIQDLFRRSTAPADVDMMEASI